MMADDSGGQCVGSEVEVEIAPWTSGAPRGCGMPSAMDPIEARLYERVRTIHCDRKVASHDCHGRVTLDRNGMTLQCPLCGDNRTVYRVIPSSEDVEVGRGE